MGVCADMHKYGAQEMWATTEHDSLLCFPQKWEHGILCCCRHDGTESQLTRRTGSGLLQDGPKSRNNVKKCTSYESLWGLMSSPNQIEDVRETCL